MKLDATKAGTNANAYATVKETDDYLESVYGTAEWEKIGICFFRNQICQRCDCVSTLLAPQPAVRPRGLTSARIKA
jgi:acetone carboxylase gamma subunit